MSLVTSSAYTETWRTSYYFNTAAGVDIFFDCFAEQQRAMLHPDYTDEEIRLEVRNFGVTQGADGRRRLEEKGTVYNEMVASMANGALAGLAGAEPRRLRHPPHRSRSTRAASRRASGR